MNFCGGEFGPQFKFLLFNLGLTNFERVSQKSVSVDNFKTELHLAFADSGEIEKIVDQARFQLDVAANELKRFMHHLRNVLLAFEHRHGSQNRSERRSQLVTQHREKTIL